MAFAALLTVVLVAALWLFASPPGWFPAPISTLAAAFDAQFTRTLWLLGFAFLLVQGVLVYAVLRYRARGGTAATFTGSRRLEFAWTAITAVLFIGVTLWGMPVFTLPHMGPEPAGAERIEVYAHQFAWNFRYPGADGVFGKTDIRFINDAGGNPVGLDEADTAAKDDVVTATLRVPVGREIALTLRSRDVIHDFFVRELRIKQDVVPGMDIPYRFRAEKTGSFEIACAELCGLGHSQMRAVMVVLSAADYDRWKEAATLK